eukprot:549142_1
MSIGDIIVYLLLLFLFCSTFTIHRLHGHMRRGKDQLNFMLIVHDNDDMTRIPDAINIKPFRNKDQTLMNENSKSHSDQFNICLAIVLLWLIIVPDPIYYHLETEDEFRNSLHLMNSSLILSSLPVDVTFHHQYQCSHTHNTSTSSNINCTRSKASKPRGLVDYMGYMATNTHHLMTDQFDILPVTHDDNTWKLEDPHDTLSIFTCVLLTYCELCSKVQCILITCVLQRIQCILITLHVAEQMSNFQFLFTFILFDEEEIKKVRNSLQIYESLVVKCLKEKLNTS